MKAPGSPKRARGRLLVQHPAPDGWRADYRGWSPASPARRCACGAPVVARSAKWTRCARGCVHLPQRPAPQSATFAAPPPLPPKVLAIVKDLRLLEADFARATLRGKRPSARAVSFAVQALVKLKEGYQDQAEAIARALPWLERAGEARR